MPGGKAGSLPKECSSRIPSQQTSRKSCPGVPELFTEKNPTSTRPTLPAGSAAANTTVRHCKVIQARRAKQLSSAYKESSPSLDQRMGAG